MKEIPTSDLSVDSALDGYICHKSGEILHRPGEVLSLTHQALLHECEIDSVIYLPGDTDPDSVKKSAGLQQISMDDIKIGESVPVALYTDGESPIINEGESFSKQLYDKLSAAGTTTLFYKKDPMELQSLQYQMYRMLLDSDKVESIERVVDLNQKENIEHLPENAPSDESDVKDLQNEPIPEDRFILSPSKNISATLCKQLMKQPDSLSVEISGTLVKTPVQKLETRDKAELDEFKELYLNWVAKTEDIFSKLKANKETGFEDIESIIRDIITNYFRDSWYYLNLLNLRHPPTSDKYLSMHSLNVAIIAIGMGVMLGYSMPLIRELAIGALLHDIGHLLTYRPFLNKKNLDSTEQLKYDQHCNVGMAMLKNITKVPISTMLVVAQHHERLDGSGRIFHAKGSELHEFVRLVSVVDTFESSCRFFKVTASIALTVSAAQKGKLELKFVKALISLLSLFPIGISLSTSNRLICKVIGAHENAFKTPILRSIYSMQDGHLFSIDKQELFDLQKEKIKIIQEVNHSALKSDIAMGFRTPD